MIPLPAPVDLKGYQALAMDGYLSSGSIDTTRNLRTVFPTP
jgi:hypothetical protein